jgi:hypothetical protein
MKKLITLFGLLCLILNISFSQDDYQLTIRKATSAIVLDGQLDEQAWLVADTTTSFNRTFRLIRPEQLYRP